MARHEPWSFGDVIVLRNVAEVDPGHHERHVGYAHTARVIADDDRHAVLYQPPKTVHKERNGERGGPRARNLVRGGWDGTHSEREWHGDGVVFVHAWGEPWSVWRWVDRGGVWSAYFYVNFERPWVRTRLGYDTEDWVLDLVISGEERAVRVKDADELEWCVSVGTISAEQAELTRRSTDRVTAMASANEWPFSADWSAWTPQREWDAQPLPADWSVLEPMGRE